MARTKGSVNKDHQVVRLPWAPRYMVALENRYNQLRADRLMIEGAMRHDPDNNQRGSVTRAASSVSATTVRATPRKRVADSHDARPASDRSSARPYSRARFASDVRYGRTTGSEVRSVTIPNLRLMSPGFAHLVATERLMSGEGVTTFTVEPERKSRKRRTTDAELLAVERLARRQAMLDALGSQADID